MGGGPAPHQPVGDAGPVPNLSKPQSSPVKMDMKGRGTIVTGERDGAGMVHGSREGTGRLVHNQHSTSRVHNPPPQPPLFSRLTISPVALPLSPSYDEPLYQTLCKEKWVGIDAEGLPGHQPQSDSTSVLHIETPIWWPKGKNFYL